jgi:SnoaL-like domain
VPERRTVSHERDENLPEQSELEELRARLDILESKQAIVELLATYCRAVDRGDVDLLKSVYHPDAIDDHDKAFSGNAHELAEFIIPLLTRSYPHRHAMSNHLIELDGDRAFCESRYASSHRVTVNSSTAFDIEAYGRYLDVIERRDGVWKIAYRRLFVERTFTRPLSDYDIQSAVLTPPFPLDPVYEGFATPASRPEDHRLSGGIFDRLLATYGSE